ncbi:MAG: hypothetical protein ABH803_03700 [Candidatus Micrarchaeota archaeon]
MLGFLFESLGYCVEPEKLAFKKKEARLYKGVLLISKYAAVYGFFLGVAVVLSFFFLVDFISLPFPFSGLLGILSFVAIPLITVSFIVVSVVLSLVVSGLIHLIAMIFGGHGSFEEFFYLNSLLYPSLSVITFALFCIPFLASVITFLWYLYVLYLYFRIVQIVHKIWLV